MMTSTMCAAGPGLRNVPGCTAGTQLRSQERAYAASANPSALLLPTQAVWATKHEHTPSSIRAA